MTPLPLLLGIVLAGPQEPAPAEPPSAQELIAGYRALPEDRRRLVVRGLERRLQLEPYEPLQRIVSMQRGMDSYPDLLPRPLHDPAKVAPGVAPARKQVAVDSAAWLKVRQAFPAPPFLDDLQAAVVYDWHAGAAVRQRRELDDDATFANLAHGLPPGSDHAVARIQAALDQDPRQRALARWFEHTYADVNGNAFPGVTLYHAWYSGRQVDVPDVDAIPFARDILKTQAFRSPIPADRRRERLYQKIMEAALEHRQYRTLRQAAAAAFVAADPAFDATYRPLIARFHYLWASHGWDPEALAKVLQQAGDRSTLLDEVDQKVRTDPDAMELRERTRGELQQVARYLRELAAHELERARQ